MATIEINFRPYLDRVELDKQMDALVKIAPANDAEWARWWYRGAELWANVATLERQPNNSTVHAFMKAKEKYALVGDLEMVKSCEDAIEAYAHWIDSHAKRTAK